MRQPGQRQRRGLDPRVMLAATQIFGRIHRMERKPPVTLGLMALNAALYFEPALFLGIGEARLCPSRLMAGEHPAAWGVAWNFVHADDGGWHLYYNMGSLLAKGVLLELSLGSERFAVLVGVIALLTSVLYVGLAYLLTVVLGVAATYTGCVHGFSGVLFGMSVVVHRSPSVARLQPMPGQLRGFFPGQATIDIKYLVWAELVSSQTSSLGLPVVLASV